MKRRHSEYYVNPGPDAKSNELKERKLYIEQSMDEKEQELIDLTTDDIFPGRRLSLRKPRSESCVQCSRVCFVCKGIADGTSTCIYRERDKITKYGTLVVTNNVDTIPGSRRFVELGYLLCIYCINLYVRPRMWNIESRFIELQLSACETLNQSSCALHINRCRWGMTRENQQMRCMPINKRALVPVGLALDIDTTKSAYRKEVDQIENELTRFKKAFIRSSASSFREHNFKNVYDEETMRKLDMHTTLTIEEKRHLLAKLQSLLPQEEQSPSTEEDSSTEED